MFNQSNAVWQQAAVKNYLQNHPQDSQFPPAGSFDSFGRATPDVSALGEGYQVYANGKVTPVGGTSASTPAFAGMVALLNEARAQHNKQPLGFLNPFVYQNRSTEGFSFFLSYIDSNSQNNTSSFFAV